MTTTLKLTKSQANLIAILRDGGTCRQLNDSLQVRAFTSGDEPLVTMHRISPNTIKSLIHMGLIRSYVSPGLTISYVLTTEKRYL